ncbi:MAG: histidine phosphatase family protein [Actinomycetota bacterium]|nr:histidine phosphatase family protein [Actinomycetota bacterium]
MTHLILVRHGETPWHDENRYAGSSDIGLAAAGRDQAERLARWAARSDLDELCSSPLRRAWETAAAVGRATGLEPRPDDRLREIGFGEAEGRTLIELEQLYPEAVRAFRADPVTHHLPGGEDPRQAAGRAMACLRDIAGTHPAARVLLVTHNTLIRLVLCELLGLPLSRYRQTFGRMRPCARTSIELDREAASLLEYNVPIDCALP